MDSVPPLPLPASRPPARTSLLAIWSTVLGGLGLAVCLPAVLGLLLAIIALVKIKNSQGMLRGKRWAIAGIALAVIAPFSSAIVAALGSRSLKAGIEKLASARTLAEAREGYKTKLKQQVQTGFEVPEPPKDVLKRVNYHSPAGDLAAYLSPVPSDGKKHPAIIWLVGGFSNSIGEVAWEPAQAENDQSASAFRAEGVVTLYPSLRGGNKNPGYHETFYGEVDDVIAAAEFLAIQPGVDPDRIYLGGHSTGGTLALLAAECTPRFRAVFSFGPAAYVSSYGSDNLTFEQNVVELNFRNPVSWLHAIKSPTFIFEGDKEPSNIDSLRALEKQNKNPLVTIRTVPGKTHFSILSPMTHEIARQILADTHNAPHFDFTTPLPQ